MDINSGSATIFIPDNLTTDEFKEVLDRLQVTRVNSYNITKSIEENEKSHRKMIVVKNIFDKRDYMDTH